MEENFTVECIDTLQHLSLHDCFITDMKMHENKLFFYMSHLEILSSHPLNHYDFAKTTDSGLLIFYDFEIKNVKLCDTGQIDNNGFNFHELFQSSEVLKVDMIYTSGNIYAYHFTVDRHEYNDVVGEFDLFCSHIKICWNYFEKDSWFMSWN